VMCEKAWILLCLYLMEVVDRASNCWDDPTHPGHDLQSVSTYRMTTECDGKVSKSIFNEYTFINSVICNDFLRVEDDHRMTSASWKGL
jgi:hypothetical protein